jgi:hypothetical protein
MAHCKRRPALRATLALALAALLTLAAPAGVLAQAARPDATRAALATERYYSSYGATAARPDGLRAAQAAERYYASYGTPRPLTAPTTSAQAVTHGGPSWTAAVLAGAVLIVVAAGLGVLAGRAGIVRAG